MKYFILVTFFICYRLFITDIEAVFTLDDCKNCCNGLTFNSSTCVIACILKFEKSQDYNSREECNRNCRVGLGACRERCWDDCTERYEPGIPGVRPIPRRDKERQRRKEARARGEEGYKVWKHITMVYDPHSTKRNTKRKKDDAESSDKSKRSST